MPDQPPDTSRPRFDGEAAPTLVRPYALTKGRTTPSVELPIEATLEVLDHDERHDFDDVKSAMVELCERNPSVAEVAALSHQPLGVTRVLLADLIGAGVLAIRATLTEESSDQERHDLIERTLRGLRAL